MATSESTPLLIKRYASRRLYNTETSDYVTLDDISGFIRAGRDVQIVDLKSGDDLTRQYLLQIIAERESRGDNVLPTNVLTDLVRSYTEGAQTMVPDFLAASFDMLRDGQAKMVESMSGPMLEMFLGRHNQKVKSTIILAITDIITTLCRDNALSS